MIRNPSTQVMFINHSSLLIKKGSQYLLTDPWYQKPAFGSWLPTFPQYIHPSYLASLGKNLSILISHGHDDHCDDQLLSIFHKDTRFITAHFPSPSVVNRLKKLGFENIVTVGPEGEAFENGFTLKSYITPEKSPEDAIFTIDTKDGVIIHCNDNWFEFDNTVLQALTEDCSMYESNSIAFFSQTNSASGYPMNYRMLTASEKIHILESKVIKMVTQGMRNALNLSLKKFYSYAGYASVFVNKKPNYLFDGLVPVPDTLTQLIEKYEISEDLKQVSIADFCPGDVLRLYDGHIEKAFISSMNYTAQDIKKSSTTYYEKYNILQQCDTFKPTSLFDINLDKLRYFLKSFDEYVTRKIKQDSQYFSSIIGKVFEVHIEDIDLSLSIQFGTGIVSSPTILPNKRLIVSSSLLSLVVEGEILFENLYTGYEAEWERHPVDVYNRDIIMFIVMFSYVYKNRLCSMYTQESTTR